MIRLKNRNEFLVFAGKAGAAATGAYFTLKLPFACDLAAIDGKVRVAGTTGTQTTDIQKNGTSIFSGAGKLDFASGATAATYGARTADPTAFVKGDILTFNITAIHTTPATDTAVSVTLRRSVSQPKAVSTITDAVE